VGPEHEKDLLKLLQENAKLSYETLATMLGEEVETLRQRVESWEQEGIIRGYAAIVNWDRVDEDRVTAIIEVTVIPQRSVGFDEVARRIYRFPEVQAVLLLSGSYDLQVVVEGHRIQEVARFVSERLAAIDFIQSTTTHFILKTYKVDGVVLEDGDDDQRLVITP
jgi:DNA-binding Lrp family transcriptional regulator